MYIDLENVLYFVQFGKKQRMTIEGQSMRIQTTTTTFKPIKVTPIVPVWISLPELPWHCYYKEILIVILFPVLHIHHFILYIYIYVCVLLMYSCLMISLILHKFKSKLTWTCRESEIALSKLNHLITRKKWVGIRN